MTYTLYILMADRVYTVTGDGRIDCKLKAYSYWGTAWKPLYGIRVRLR